MFLVLMALGVAVIGGGVVAIARLTREPEGVRRLLEAPQRAIADVPDAAEARIAGTVELVDGAVVTAPLSGEACVYVEHTAREAEDVGVLGGSAAIAGRIIRRRVKAVPFVVRDASGYAIVDPDGATALLPVFHEVADREGHVRLAFRRGFATPLARRAGGLYEEERVIRAGDRLVVIGRGVREPDPDPASAHGGYRDGSATRLRLTHSPQLPLHLIDPDRTL